MSGVKVNAELYLSVCPVVVVGMAVRTVCSQCCDSVGDVVSAGVFGLCTQGSLCRTVLIDDGGMRVVRFDIQVRCAVFMYCVVL